MKSCTQIENKNLFGVLEDGIFFSGLAALVQLYVQAINSPDMTPNVQNAWDTFVKMKSLGATREAVEIYEAEMASQLNDKLPFDNEVLHRSHQIAFENSEGYFMTETAGISTNTTEKYLDKLKV